MTFIEKVFKTVGDFFAAYGEAFVMMIVAGFIIAFIVEVAIKKAFAWLESRFEGKEKILAALAIAKMIVIFAVTIAATALSTHLIMTGGIALPGNKALAPFWFAVIYLCQYVFSMYGIKGLLGLKDKEQKEKAVKKDPLEGLTRYSEKLWTDGKGNYFNKKGEKQ